MGVEIPYHGQTHRPGGSDPIAGVAPVGYQTHYQFNGEGLWNAQWLTTNTLVADTAAPYGVYADMTSFPPSSGGWAFPVMLCGHGVRDTVAGGVAQPDSEVPWWEISFVARRGPDVGIFDLQIASAVVDGSNKALVHYDPRLNYQSIGTYDMYNATHTWLDGVGAFVPRQAWVQISGSPGQVGTTLTTIGQVDGLIRKRWDGGPGLHWVRLIMLTKNASSSAYRMRLAGISITLSPMMDANGFDI